MTGIIFFIVFTSQRLANVLLIWYPLSSRISHQHERKQDHMNKAELIDAVAEQAGVTKKDAASMLDATLDSIAAALVAGDSVRLTGFGTFEIKARAARTGRNPRTKEAVQIPASKSPAFKPGKTLKETVNR